MKTKKLVFIFTVAVSIIFGIQSFSYGEKPVSIVIGTGGLGGTFYVHGGGICMILQKYGKAVSEATAQITAGSRENSLLIGAAELDFALANSVVVGESYRGSEKFGKGIKNIRTCFWGNETEAHLIVKKGKGYKSLLDLKGKKMSIGAPGSGAVFNFMQLIEAYGISLNEFKPYYLGAMQSYEALKDGRLDAVFTGHGVPGAAATSLAMTTDIDILPIPEEIVNKIVEKDPGYIKAIIPAGIYRGIDRDIPTFGPVASFICHEGLSEELVYQVMKGIHDNLDWLAENVHRAFKKYRFHPSVQNIAPLHPGAIKFYKEKGLIK